MRTGTRSRSRREPGPARPSVTPRPGVERRWATAGSWSLRRCSGPATETVALAGTEARQLTRQSTAGCSPRVQVSRCEPRSRLDGRCRWQPSSRVKRPYRSCPSGARRACPSARDATLSIPLWTELVLRLAALRAAPSMASLPNFPIANRSFRSADGPTRFMCSSVTTQTGTQRVRAANLANGLPRGRRQRTDARRAAGVSRLPGDWGHPRRIVGRSGVVLSCKGGDRDSAA